MTNLGQCFFESADRFPDRAALLVEGQQITYRQLSELARHVSYRVNKTNPEGCNQVGVFGSRCIGLYAGILGTLAAGKTYVPLNPDFPPDRTAAMIEASGAKTVLVTSSYWDLWCKVKETGHLEVETIEVPDELPPVLPVPGTIQHSSTTDNPYAYLLFTSGSTGKPKGVAVTHDNVYAYLDGLRSVSGYTFTEEDRFSHTFESTFDLSVHDMFLTFSVGGCLCVIPKRQLINPATFIRNNELTVWFSVPTSAEFIKKLGSLKPGSFPSLRVSMFCGEALPATLADSWLAAAPNSIIENLYGPTEATIAITIYRWHGSSNETGILPQGLVPIGKPFPGQSTSFLSPETGSATSGKGELLLGGSQITDGYWRDPEKTANQFIQLDNSGQVWYRTGDLAEMREDGELLFLGRLDTQIKIGGHRVELGEIENAMTEASGAKAVAWIEESPESQKFIAVAIESENPEPPSTALEQLRQRLPSYMIPKIVHQLCPFPTNANGKTDRNKIKARFSN